MLTAGLLQGASRAATWFPLGPFGGDVRSLAADPADPSHHLFLGTATGWVYDSHDGGASWARVSQIANRNDLAVDHILVDRSNPKRLVVAAWVIGKSTDGGIFISEDYGKSWYSQAEMRGQSVRSLARSESNVQELVAGTLKGVYRSMDNGVHWQQISPVEGVESTEIHEVESVAIDPADPNVIYVGTWNLPWKTTDGGASWHSIKDGIIDDSDVFSIIVDPKQPNVIFASACSGIYKSSDSGDVFRKVQGIPSTARRTRKLAQDPEQLDTVFAGTTEGLYRSLDAGAQWERMTPADVIVNDVYVDPADSKRVVLATDRGGILRSDDGGTTFEASNAGFSARQVLGYAQDAQHPETLYVGLVNDKTTGGVFTSTDGAVHWQQQSDGLDGRDVFSLLSLPDGTLLAGTGHGVFRFEDAKWADSSALEGSAEPAKTKPNARLILPPPGIAVRGSSRVTAVRTASKAVRSPTPKRAVAGKGIHRASVQTALTRKARLTTRGAGASARRRVHVLPVNAHGARRATVVKTSLRQTGSHHPAAQANPSDAARAETHRSTVHTVGKDEKAGQLLSTVYTLLAADGTIYAGSGQGLLKSSDSGRHWAILTVPEIADLKFLAITPPVSETSASDAAVTVLAAGLEKASLSVDGGQSWELVTLPSGLTQIGAVGIDGEKRLWIGGREGVWFSSDRGATWKTLRNLFLTQVDSLFYDATQHRMLVTAANSPAAFSVQLPDDKVSYLDTGWRLRFVRPVGNHLVAATLFDGMVVQPEMVATPLSSAGKSSN